MLTFYGSYTCQPGEIQGSPSPLSWRKKKKKTGMIKKSLVGCTYTLTYSPVVVVVDFAFWMFLFELNLS